MKKADSTKEKLKEIKGLYIFYENDIPVYVGISRKILRRLRNHFVGKSHYQATLVYLMLRDVYDNDEKNDIYRGKRSEFEPFNNGGREEKQEELINNFEISIIPIEDNYELYLTEVLAACELKTKWNCFQTH